jgi:hypothetical protein
MAKVKKSYEYLSRKRLSANSSIENGAKTSNGRRTPTAVVFWQRGRGHNHQAGGRGKDKVMIKTQRKNVRRATTIDYNFSSAAFRRLLP